MRGGTAHHHRPRPRQEVTYERGKNSSAFVSMREEVVKVMEGGTVAKESEGGTVS